MQRLLLRATAALSARCTTEEEFSTEHSIGIATNDRTRRLLLPFAYTNETRLIRFYYGCKTTGVARSPLGVDGNPRARVPNFRPNRYTVDWS